MKVYTGTFAAVVRSLLRDFEVAAEPVDVGQWQSLDIKGDRSKVTWELREASLGFGMASTIEGAQREYSPNLPWAEDHFLERIGGRPLNPPPSQAWWPFAQAGHKDHLKEGKFSHTYPERFWPKHAGHDACNCPYEAEMRDTKDEGYYSGYWGCAYRARQGIRFEYGDFTDVVARLAKNPLTRQAFLPIWFPEDTGAPEGERVPCTLGYLFMIRNGKLHVTYYIRSCDFMRHWRDDVYMAVRLAQEVRDRLSIGVELGELTMHIGSFHVFEGDRAMVRHLNKEADKSYFAQLMEGLS